ncbi:NTP transferase domain-containing protein [Mediterraneibacter agrestimuris]|uniref:NTP transferase domain-containing protein n=1 Tax=Mediterraneibacter agrestimuris TaxID=2941333 RepID=UPI0020408655|nr:NTP transferase domain-containing protein [Mediterraneibacter agrestimuris]
MGYKVDNAIIMAAGASSRFAPLSYEIPKALITVKGEVLLERQIRQLQEAGISKIIVVVGYMKERFSYLTEKMGVKIVENNAFNVRNNNSSIYAVREYLGNSYICSADNYFTVNPFEKEVDDAYYAGVYASGETREWCMETGSDGYVNHVEIGGENAWYMLGHAFWNETFSRKFKEILLREYDLQETADKLWEAIYKEHLDELKLKIRHYADDFIFEFDSLDELRTFDSSYINDTRSIILKRIASELGCLEGEITDIREIKDEAGIQAVGFEFMYGSDIYEYFYGQKNWRKR